jgi:predicted nucleic acid-binding protein
MTSGSEGTRERALDSMFMIYVLVGGDHPATEITKAFLRERQGWFTLPTCFLEAYHALVRVYRVDPASAIERIGDFSGGPVTTVPVAGDDALAAFAVARDAGVDLSDALLLRACGNLGVRVLATDDAHLARAAAARGLLIENPIDPALRQEIAEWEDAHLPPKGLPRVLHAVSQWLDGQSREIAESFTNATGNRAHLP